MAAWRSMALVSMVLAAPAAWAQSHSLSEQLSKGQAFRQQLTMQLAGERRLRQDDEEVKQPLSAQASHDFKERILAVEDGLAVKAARHYDQARVVITLNERSFQTTLDEERRLIVAQRHKDDLICWSPAGPLRREELEATADHFDTLALTGLLPGKAVAIGDTWKPANPVIQALCAFDGLISHDLTGKLEAVNADVARIAFTGSAQGIEDGALVKRTITASAQFNLKAKHLTRLEWKQKDQREPGPVSPGSTIETTWTIQRRLLAELPRELSDVALVKVPEGNQPPAASCLGLSHREAKGRYQLTYPRAWQIVGQTENHLILRLLERGDFVAQATFAHLTPAEPGQHMSAEEFKQLVDDMPGWEAEEMRDDGEVPSAKGYWAYRLSGVGELDGLRVLQIFYLLAGKDGRQLAIHFTLRPTLAEKLGNQDLDLIGGIELREMSNDQ